MSTRYELNAIARRDIVDANYAMIGINLFGVVTLLNGVIGAHDAIHIIGGQAFYQTGAKKRWERREVTRRRVHEGMAGRAASTLDKRASAGRQ
jgi:hypothetical protein